jgi:hypothetical protein
MNNVEHLNRLNEALKELQAILTEKKASELSQLEIDLSLDKIKRIYEIALKLIPVSVPDATSKTIEMEQEVVECDSESFGQTDEPDPEPEETEPEKEALSFENEERETMETFPEIEIKKEEKKAGEVLDLFNETLVPEKMDKQPIRKEETPIEKESVAEKLQKNKLKSIKSAIGINEKFFFLNELFNGDLNIYNISIEKLDSKNQLEEALLLLTELSESFNWNKESEALNELTKMLENKFS